MFGIKGFWYRIQGEIVPATVLPMIAQVGLMTGWRFKLVGYPWPDEGRKVFLGEAGSGKSRSHWCIANGIYSWCDGSGLHSSDSEIAHCSISVLLHWFGPLKYYSYMLLEQVFTFTVFTGDFCLSSRLWLQEWQVGPQRARNRIGIFYLSYGGINFGHYDATLNHVLFLRKVTRDYIWR